MTDQIGTRQRELLKLLLEHKDGLSIDEMSKALVISRNAVQQHIAVLELEGYLQGGDLNRTAGRPVRRYVLTEAGINSFPKQYAWFCKLMLTTMKDEMGEQDFENYMSILGKKISENYLFRFAGKKTAERCKELLKIMDDFGYRTAKSVDNESSEDLSIKAYNCIFHDLAQTHHEICKFDIAIVSTLLGEDVELTECMATGGGLCCFKIKQPRG